MRDIRAKKELLRAFIKKNVQKADTSNTKVIRAAPDDILMYYEAN